MGTKAHGGLLDLGHHATDFSKLRRNGSDLVRNFLVVFDHRGTRILLLITALFPSLVTFPLALVLALPTILRLLIARIGTTNGSVSGYICRIQEGPVVATGQKTLPQNKLDKFQYWTRPLLWGSLVHQGTGIGESYNKFNKSKNCNELEYEVDNKLWHNIILNEEWELLAWLVKSHGGVKIIRIPNMNRFSIGTKDCGQLGHPCGLRAWPPTPAASAPHPPEPKNPRPWRAHSPERCHGEEVQQVKLIQGVLCIWFINYYTNIIHISYMYIYIYIHSDICKRFKYIIYGKQ